jgi:hypothetical protein
MAKALRALCWGAGQQKPPLILQPTLTLVLAESADK